ncbi:hypothetical protein [Nitrospina gracilis]|uniref:hypothetical protein n=1 Tax=Nitrospina gracilis TaxID=35801 RepID=UPI001F43C847|nr:hypothetical protein [Nitrospina gracilis]MCF8720736.1 hypothetical protein [Nitrospina gracilis Nb-211]
MNEYSKYLILKSSIENLFGSDAWYALKESNHLKTWRKYAEKTLKAIELSIKDTVEIYDEEWMQEIEKNIQRGIEGIKLRKSIDEIIAVLCGTLINISFLQIGQIPGKKGSSHKYPLKKGKWRLNSYRQVIYLQTKAQKEDLFMDNQRSEIGSERQMQLLNEYYLSKSKLKYSEWCNENGKV